MDGQVMWDYRVVLDLFLGGIGIGAFILASVLYLVDKDGYKQISKVAFIIAPIFVIVGLMLLMAKLGRPLNAHAMMLNINPTSIMSLGGLLQGAFVAIALFALYKVIKDEVIPNGLLYLGLAFACLVGIYHGTLLSSFGRSAWNFAIPALFFVTSIGTGILTSLFVSKLLGSSDVNSRVVSATISGVSLLALLLTFGWVYALAATDAESILAYEYLFSGYLMLFVVAVVLGMIVPLALSVKALINKETLSQTTLTVVSISALIGTYFLKYIVVYIGQLEYFA
jgi:protein NrfD